MKMVCFNPRLMPAVPVPTEPSVLREMFGVRNVGRTGYQPVADPPKSHSLSGARDAMDWDSISIFLLRRWGLAGSLSYDNVPAKP